MTQAAFTEQTDPFCVSRVDAVAMLAGAPWARFAVIGDSLSAGIGDPTPGYTNLGWSDRLAELLRTVRPDLEYLNSAERGATTVQTLETQVAQMAEFAPDLLHLPSGGNDIIRRKPDYGEIEGGLRRMYDLAKGTGALLTTFTLARAYVVPVFPDFPERVVKVNAITRELASEYGAIVVDMWDHPVNDRDNLLSADRIHFSTSGQAVIAAEVVRTLAGLVRQAASALIPPQRGTPAR